MNGWKADRFELSIEFGRPHGNGSRRWLYRGFDNRPDVVHVTDRPQLRGEPRCRGIAERGCDEIVEFALEPIVVEGDKPRAERLVGLPRELAARCGDRHAGRAQ